MKESITTPNADLAVPIQVAAPMSIPSKYREPTHKWSLEVVVLIGMAAGAMAYFCIAQGIEMLLVERWRPPAGPRLSSGQAFLMMFPLVALLGAACAAASYLERGKTQNWLASSVFAAPILVLLAATTFWGMDAGRNGYDPSHLSLYAPVVVASLICAVINPVLMSFQKRGPLIR